MKNLLMAIGTALNRICAELCKYESGEFMTTRQKSRLLDEMMHEQGAPRVAKPAVRTAANLRPLTIAHGHSL